MDNKLLVRAYNVGLGDCFYIRIPDLNRNYHFLIDCGNKYGKTEHLQEALEDLEEQLPPVDVAHPDQKKRLDVLIVTHRHEDHIKGFDPKWFENIQIDRIWLSAAIDLNHPQAEKSHELHGFVMDALADFNQNPLTPAFGDLVSSLLSLNNDGALKALRQDLPAASNIQPTYVHADTPDDELLQFEDPDIKVSILGPMNDIDGFYLGRTHDEMLGFAGYQSLIAGDSGGNEGRSKPPSNISAGDFRRLQRRLHNSALAFVLKEGRLVNNTSTVLLIEWRGRRLLFVGDAQFKTAFKGAVKEGTSNGSWNVMWQERKTALSQPLDFLKIGHHGSHNATPWHPHEPGKQEHPINEILDALLPKPAEGELPTAKALVSTQRTNSYKKIPLPELMEELGKRVANTALYDEPEDKGFFVADDVPQPQRTDMAHQIEGGDRVPFIDAEFDPKAD